MRTESKIQTETEDPHGCCLLVQIDQTLLMISVSVSCRLGQYSKILKTPSTMLFKLS